MDLEEQYDKLLRYCYMNVRDRELAEDITQDTFVRFLKSNEGRDSGNDMALLYTIARNLCLDSFKKKKDLFFDDLAPDMQDALASDESGEERLIEKLSIERALDKLPRDDREIVTLRYVSGLSALEIGKIMNVSRFAIHRRLSAALKKLKEEMEV